MSYDSAFLEGKSFSRFIDEAKVNKGLWAELAEGAFPKPVQLGARAVGWIEAEVDEWIRQQVAISRGDAE